MTKYNVTYYTCDRAEPLRAFDVEANEVRVLAQGIVFANDGTASSVVAVFPIGSLVVTT